MTIRKVILIGLIILILGGGAYIYIAKPDFIPGMKKNTKGDEGAQLYQCPMHPTYTSDKPGECPICGMTLVPVEELSESESEEAQPTDMQTETAQEKSGKKKERKILYWVAPMDPTYKSDKPGKSPMGMDLIPVYADEVEGGASQEEMPPGLTRIKISSRRQQLLGIRTDEVRKEHVIKYIRTVGVVTYDETRVSHIHTKIHGWIEEIYVDFTGQEVKKGQPLLAIYSPELVATQEEYLRARRLLLQMEKTGRNELIDSAKRLLESARKRLEFWDIPAREIERLEKTGQTFKTLTLYSPVTGFVIEKKALLGMEVEPKMELYTIADLSVVWVNADIYEFEIADVHVGMEAKLTLSYYPGKVWNGEVDYVYPYLDTKTRTNKVRFTFSNPTGELKPGMYVNVELEIDKGENLVVSDEAILDAGEEKYVFVAEGNGFFEPRLVVVGEKVGEKRIVIKGLQEGERVVVSGNFLIDSESRLKAALLGIGGKKGGSHGN